jgi:alpha/beta superfamily hydrolase
MIPEQSVTIPVAAGLSLEGALALSNEPASGVVLCHPHPQYGGDMDSPVVTTAAGACQGQGLATLRFNFRGIGGSQGAWDEGRGEQDDVRAALSFLGQRLSPTAALALAGYSFGASMAARVAAGSDRLAGLALIAPPLASPGWQPLSAFHVEGPILLVAGRDDQYCPPDALTTLGRMIPAATIIVVDGTDHFFFTALEALASAVAGWASRIKR